jgi:peptidoglycan hydrolase CwlO-like protein
MDTQNIENTLKKMGLVLEKLVQKVDELDKRVAKLEEINENNEKKFSSEDFKAKPQPQTTVQNSASNSLSSGFGGSFLGSMAGAMAGMGLYNLLFNHNVSPVEMGQSLGMDNNEINEVLQNDISEIDTKLDEIDAKLDELDEKIDNVSSGLDEDVMSSEYFENYEDEVADNDFEGGFDDFEGLDDFGGFDDI